MSFGMLCSFLASHKAIAICLASELSPTGVVSRPRDGRLGKSFAKIAPSSRANSPKSSSRRLWTLTRYAPQRLAYCYLDGPLPPDRGPS